MCSLLLFGISLKVEWKKKPLVCEHDFRLESRSYLKQGNTKDCIPATSFAKYNGVNLVIFLI